MQFCACWVFRHAALLVPPARRVPAPYSGIRGYVLLYFKLTHFLFVLLQVALATEFKQDIPDAILAKLVDEADNVFVV